MLFVSKFVSRFYQIELNKVKLARLKITSKTTTNHYKIAI